MTHSATENCFANYSSVIMIMIIIIIKG